MADAPLTAALGQDGRVVAMVGFMGAGKSTAARSAARALGTDAVDVDEVIEQRLGKPIAEIFAADGEAAFRERRGADHARAAATRSGTRVVALGGGALGIRPVREGLAGHLTRGSTSTPRPPGSAVRGRAARWPPTGPGSRSCTPSGSRSMPRWPTSSSRHRRSQDMAAVLAALVGVPDGHHDCCGRPAPPATTRPTSAPVCSPSTASGPRRYPAGASWSPTATPGGSTATRWARSTAG